MPIVKSNLRVTLPPIVIVASFVALVSSRCGERASQISKLSDSHPFQTNLRCERVVSDIMEAKMYLIAPSGESLLGTFKSGHVASCEFSRRASRNSQVCIEDDRIGSYKAINVNSKQIINSFGPNLRACLDFTRGQLDTTDSPGFVSFINKSELDITLENLPQLEDIKINDVLRNPNTMWYDESSMVFSYQDSFGRPEGPEGLRANRVGFDVGSTSSVPDISLLTNYFEPGRFRFPFSIVSGGIAPINTYVANFWLPPRSPQGNVIPVSWWLNDSHWHWVFPVGTVLGEVMLTRDSETGKYFPFEIRARTREAKKWHTSIFRPFTSSKEMATAIQIARPNWETTDLKQLVDQLRNDNSLVPAKLESTPYKAVFPTINGALDVLPGTTDRELIRNLLTKTVYKSAMGTSWKSNENLTTFAASTEADFHIVPKGYNAGILATNEATCTKCHEQTGRPLGQLNHKLVLYGEVWGEDQVFTWHPFQVKAEMFTVSDGSRQPNTRMLNAGLIKMNKPAPGDQTYVELQRPYPAIFK